MNHFVRIAFIATLLAVAGPAFAEVINDRSQFVGDFTVIDFETRGDGTPLVLGQSEAIPIHADEYSPQGITLTSTNLIIANDGDKNADEALAIVGSPENILADAAFPGFVRIDFDAPVNGVGIAVLNFTTPDGSKGGPVIFSAYNTLDDLIETVEFEGDLVDGVIQSADPPFFLTSYGFMGVFSPDDPIAYAIITEALTDLDDLHFGMIPEPASLVLLGTGLVWMVRRRRR
ncbi:MAG: PEP-CTERM sorting domain-containing protein [Phycisphaerae bacterium]|jgi:hypothetical protein